MAKYEALPTIAIERNDTLLRSQVLPELVHLEDPAISVMTDFRQTAPHTIHLDEKIDRAMKEMESAGTSVLLVVDNEGRFQGVITSEDLLGEKPIKIIQERRIHRDQICARMIMVPHTQITAVDLSIVEHARVGNIVKTFSLHKQHYMLVVLPHADDSTKQIICGIFTASQIRKQLHQDISDLFGDY